MEKYCGLEYERVGEKRFFGVAGEMIIPVPPLKISTYKDAFYYPILYSLLPRVTRKDLLWGFRMVDLDGNYPNESFGNPNHIGEICDGWVWLRPDDVWVDNPLNLYRNNSCCVKVSVNKEHLIPDSVSIDLRELEDVENGKYMYLVREFQRMKRLFAPIYDDLLTERQINKEWEEKDRNIQRKLELWRSEPEVQLTYRQIMEWFNEVQPKYRVFQQPSEM